MSSAPELRSPPRPERQLSHTAWPTLKDKEGRDRAQALHVLLSNDLRFADTKAAFVSVAIGAWLTVMNNIFTLKDFDKLPLGVKCCLAITLLGCTTGLISCVFAVWPKLRTTRGSGPSIHHTGAVKVWSLQLKSLRSKYRIVTNEMAYRLNQDEGSERWYDDSLLLDIAYMGHRCTTKYGLVRVGVFCLGLAIMSGSLGILFLWAHI